MINGLSNMPYTGYEDYASADGGYGRDEKDELKEKLDKQMGLEECQTCKNRKYQDGSDENVSFKSAAHIAPNAAGAAVRSHEAEHVSNAYTKAAEEDGKVVRASVTIHTSVCPECGRTYVSGGVTNTAIKYSNEENPYMKNFKAQQEGVLAGQNIDVYFGDK